MSMHLNLEDFRCKKCDFLYFPYNEEYPCPKCSLVANPFPNDYLDLVDGIIRSLKINKRQGGIFTPQAWSTTSYCDQVQYIVAVIFEALETEEYTEEKSHIEKILLDNNFDNNEKNHLKDIIIDVRSQYKLDPYVPPVEEPSWWSTQWERILNLFK